MARNKTSMPVWLRRVTQTVFLLLFFYLFLQTVYHPNNGEVGSITLFFDLDPLVMLTVWLGGHVVASALLFSLITLITAVLFGRWFCGWICPFGALNNLFTSMRGSKRKERLKEASYSGRQKTKYYILLIVLAGSFFGANIAGWLDPFSFLYRSFATAVFPVVNAGVQGIFDWFYNVNPIGAAAITEPVYRVLRLHFLTLAQSHYYWGILIGILFGAIIALNFYRARFWCRYLCPLGGLLGIVGKNPVVRIMVNADKCKDCLECAMDCQGGAEPQSQEGWRTAECLFCWNCYSACPIEAISFHFRTPMGKIIKDLPQWIADFFRPSAKSPGMDLGRRNIIAAGIGGLGGSLLMKVNPLSGNGSYNPGLIRPPGSISEQEFLEKCIRCGECMKVCPTNAIQLAMMEGGLEGLWTPVVKTQLGYCEYTCSMCTKVCPTNAIAKMTLEDKQKIKIGIAYIDKNRCLPYAYGRPCILCQQQCPVQGKAIIMEDAMALNFRGAKVAVKLPRVNAEKCIGCGICENRCPVSDQAAIRITSVGETRGFKNQFFTADKYSG
jgi:MauM/NapG family ferredoxin protein